MVMDSGDGIVGSDDGVVGSGDGVISSSDGVMGSGDGVLGSDDGIVGSGDDIVSMGVLVRVEVSIGVIVEIGNFSTSGTTSGVWGTSDVNEVVGMGLGGEGKNQAPIT